MVEEPRFFFSDFEIIFQFDLNKDWVNYLTIRYDVFTRRRTSQPLPGLKDQLDSKDLTAVHMGQPIHTVITNFKTIDELISTWEMYHMEYR